jgi:hypothetical protein
MGHKIGEYRVLVGRSEGKRQLEDLSVDGKIKLNCIFKKWNGEAWNVLLRLRTGTGDGLL